MAATSDERALASLLTAKSDEEVAELLSVRGVSPSVSWRDFFDAAEGMLDPAAVTHALDHLPAVPAAALSTAVRQGAPIAPEARADLAARGLATAEGAVFQAVADAVADSEAVTAVPVLEHATLGHAEEATAAERAFTSSASLADVILACLDAPLGRIGSGALGAVDRRRLVDIGAIVVAEDADVLVDIAETGGLVAGHDRAFLVTPAGRDWLGAPTGARWETLALALREALPTGLRTNEGGWIPAHTWPSAYPFDHAWPARAEQWHRRFVAWGLVTDQGAPPPWAAPLAQGGLADTAAWEQMLPTEVDRVFLQNDLTAIAPGPLSPELDVRLRTMARRESRAQASTYRFSADTVASAITAGETAESLREFLESLSLTGLPQPLAYVIDSTAARHGRVRVARDAASALTTVSSSDPGLLAALAVDQALRPLGLVSEGDHLVSRAPRDAIFWALADAKYPVVAVDSSGSAHTLDRARLAPTPEPVRPAERYASLLERLRSASRDGDAAWLERELDQAVRARAVVDVVVALPDGTTRTFRLEATGLGGGRVRGRDRAADVERTLPLRSIVSVHPTA